MLRGLAQLVRPFPGETACGDDVVVVRSESAILIAVIDALGHGERAAEVARALRASLEGADLSLGLRALFDRAHTALRGTRGAAMTAVLLRASELEACGVGNVALRSEGLALSFVPTPGVVGVRMPRLRPVVSARAPGARIVLASDGISTRMSLSDARSRDAAQACRELFDLHAKDHDDVSLAVIDL
ncbi:phosphoserine phosphatase [Sandaracinus amylolyticus]|uniref:phosphoserine phosphatase n=1 Tax=Sandaracinus amylolyticus TaxID=927083 RepID=UPI001F1C5695|nr:phosphoserine phosphatase [Sandaracinus amylolyticus]